MNIVFMGTPLFAVPSLERLVNEGYEVSCVVTQPDKPKGRGNKVIFSPVKEKANEFHIPVEQPFSIRKDMEFIDRLKNMDPDIIVVVAFGQILPPEVLSIPRMGCINVHASLLPRLRGAAPINWAIINGDSETGITTMLMAAGLDTGDMFMKESTNIGEYETSEELHDRLKVLGADVLIKTLKSLENGTLKREPQDNSKSTYAPMLNKDTGRIEWGKSSFEINNLIRGTNPWPGAYAYLEDSRIKIWCASLEEGINRSGMPGKVWKVDKCGIHVYTGDGSVVIKEIQSENGKRMSAHDYTLGHPINLGDVFK